MLSERLRDRRRELGLTQKQVVTRLRRMGVETTNKALSSLEHGAGLDVAKLPELACALECTLTYLVGLTDAPDQWRPDARHWPQPATPRRVAPPRGPWVAPVEAPPRPTGDRPSRLPRILGPLDVDGAPERSG